MVNNFSKELDKLFKKYKKNEKIIDFKDEMLDALNEKYSELLEKGQSEEQAYYESLKMLDDIKETLQTLQAENPIPIKPPKFTNALSLSVIFWLFTTLIYLGASFITNAWKFTWLAFPFALLIFTIIILSIVYKKSKINTISGLTRFSLLGLITSCTAFIYLIWSLAFSAWNYSWILFIVAILVWYIFDICVRVKISNGKKVKFKITLFDMIVIILLCTITAYLLISVITHMWKFTWLLFIVGFILIFLQIFLFTKDK